METRAVDTLGKQMYASLMDAVIEMATERTAVQKAGLKQWKEPDPRFNRGTSAAWDIIWKGDTELRKLRKALEVSKVQEEQDQIKARITEEAGKLVLKAHQAFEMAWSKEPEESVEKVLDDYKRALWDEDTYTRLRKTFATEARKAMLAGTRGANADKSISQKITIKKAVGEIILEKAGISMKDVSLSKKTPAPTGGPPAKVGSGGTGYLGEHSEEVSPKDVSLSKKTPAPTGSKEDPIGSGGTGYLGAWATAGDLIGEDKTVGGRVTIGKAFLHNMDMAYIEKLDIDHELIMLSDYEHADIFDHTPEELWDEIEKAKFLDKIKLPSGGFKYIYERAQAGAKKVGRAATDAASAAEAKTRGARRRVKEEVKYRTERGKLGAEKVADAAGDVARKVGRKIEDKVGRKDAKSRASRFLRRRQTDVREAKENVSRAARRAEVEVKYNPKLSAARRGAKNVSAAAKRVKDKVDTKENREAARGVVDTATSHFRQQVKDAGGAAAAIRDQKAAEKKAKKLRPKADVDRAVVTESRRRDKQRASSASAGRVVGQPSPVKVVGEKERIRREEEKKRKKKGTSRVNTFTP